MATYYVRPNGNDSNSGTGYQASSAWATLTKGFQTVQAGDTLYIAPGTYREAVVQTNAGTSGSVIKFIGDPDCVQFIDMNPGIVRITGANASEVPGTSGLITYQNYTEFYNLRLDSGHYGFYYSSSDYTTKVYNCFVHNMTYGILSVQSFDCLVMGCQIGYQSGIFTRCIGFANGTNFHEGSYTSSYAMMCLAIGGNVGFRSKAYNCTTSSSVGFYYSTESINCLAIGCSQGFLQGTNVVECYAIGCTYGYNSCAITGSYYNRCSSATISCTGDSPAAGNAVVHNAIDVQALKLMWNPTIINGVAGKGYVFPNPVYPSYDALNLTAKQWDGTPPIGAISPNRMELDFTEYYSQAPSIKINGKGDRILRFWAKKGIPIVKTVWVKYVSEDIYYSRIALRGTYISGTITDDVTALETWQKLSVTATPTGDGEVELVLMSKDPAVTSYSLFSDIR